MMEKYEEAEMLGREVLKTCESEPEKHKWLTNKIKRSLSLIQEKEKKKETQKREIPKKGNKNCMIF